MVKRINTPSCPVQHKKPSRSKGTVGTLKLVVSNPPPAQEKLVPSQPVTSKAGFTVEVKNRGPHLYEMKIQDSFHGLECGLPLEVEDNRDKTTSRTVICHFPAILNEGANKFLDEDETLYGMVMIQFQMKVLEQLLLFCAGYYASRLIIYMDDDQAAGFGIYQKFLVHQDPAFTENGEQTKMVIPADRETFDAWMNFMAETNHNFEQELWRVQRSSPAIRYYLKSQIKKGTVQ